MELGKKIKELRTANGLTQSQLGEMLGVSEKVVSKWENLETQPGAEMIPNLAKAFGTTTDSLFGLKNENFLGIEDLICDYIASLPPQKGFIEAQRLYSYLILGMDMREMEDSGHYDEKTLEEIHDDLKQLIEAEDQRFQHYSLNGNMMWSLTRNGTRVGMFQSQKEKLTDFSEVKPIFALLATDDMEKVLEFFFEADKNQCFTEEFVAEQSGACADTVKVFLEFLFKLKENTNEAIIEKRVALIGGEEKTVYRYAPGAWETVLRSLIICAQVLAAERRGFR